MWLVDFLLRNKTSRAACVFCLRQVLRATRLLVSFALPAKTRLFDGHEIFLAKRDTGISVDLYLFGIREPIISTLLKGEFSSRSPKGTFLDIGANIGYYSVILGGFFERVVGVEVNEALGPAYSRSNPGAIVECAAVVSDTESDYCFVKKSDTNLCSVMQGKGGGIAVGKTVSLDALLEKYSPTFVKMDIEGFEYDLILNSEFPHTPEYFFAELHFGLKKKAESIRLLKRLAGLGYRIRYAVEESKEILVLKRRNLFVIDKDIQYFIDNYPDDLAGAGDGAIEFLFVK